MSLEDIFRFISSKTTDLDKTWQLDGEWGKCDPVKFLLRSLQKPQSKGQNRKMPTFFVMNTTHPFGHLPISMKLDRIGTVLCWCWLSDMKGICHVKLPPHQFTLATGQTSSNSGKMGGLKNAVCVCVCVCGRMAVSV